MKYLGYFLMFFLTFAVGLVSMRFLDFEVKDILLEKGALLESNLYLFFFYLHIIPGIVALMSGPFQFVSYLRKKYLQAHRALGKVYVFGMYPCRDFGICYCYFCRRRLDSQTGIYVHGSDLAVFYYQSLDQHSKKRYSGSPGLDDPEFCGDFGGGDPSALDSRFHGWVWDGVYRIVCHHQLAFLGAECFCSQLDDKKEKCFRAEKGIYSPLRLVCFGIFFFF